MKNMEIEEFLEKRNIIKKQVLMMLKFIEDSYNNETLVNDAWYTIETFLSVYVTMLNQYIKSSDMSKEARERIFNDFCCRMKDVLEV